MNAPITDADQVAATEYLEALRGYVDLSLPQAFANHAAEADAVIVRWLMDTCFGCDELDRASIPFADAIQRGDHRGVKP